MTGIERLRKLSKGMHNHGVTVWQLTDDAYAERFGVTKHGPTIKNFLSDIADQIERESDVDSEGLYEENEGLRDMLNQVAWHLGLGDEVHYYSGDNYAACQSRVLDAVDGLAGREADAETVRADAMEAWRWVREHGGLDHVRTMVATLGDTLNWIRERAGVSKYEIVDYDELLDALDRRIMPEGVEWPRYEDGEPVRIGGSIADELGRAHEVTSVEVFDDAAALHWSPSEPEEFVWLVHGERARRPAVLAGDGEPLEAGQTVYNVGSSEERVVDHIEYEGGGTPNVYYADGGWDYPDLITHQRPVLDADGVPIKKGDTVYLLPGEWCDEFPCHGFHGGEGLEVFADGEAGHVPGSVQCREKEEKKVGIRGTCYPQPSQLTHTKPEPPDSAERIADDIRRMAEEWCSHPTLREASEMAANAVGEATMGVALSNLSKRCKALAERERGSDGRR